MVCSIGMVYASFAFPGQPHMMLEGCSPGLLPVTVPSRGWYSCAPSDRSSSENQHVPSLPVVRVDCCLQIFALPRPCLSRWNHQSPRLRPRQLANPIMLFVAFAMGAERRSQRSIRAPLL